MADNKTLALSKGKKVGYQGTNYRIVDIVSLTTVELVGESSKEVVIANIADLTVAQAATYKRPDLIEINDNAWETAKSRLAIIKPLLNNPLRTRAHVAEVAEKKSLHTNTLYGWLKAYENSGNLSSLLPKSRSDKGVTKLSQDIEEIIQEVIASEYLTRQRKSQQKVCDQVKSQCLKLGIIAPHENTIRNRIKAISGELAAAKRLGKKAADKFKPIDGSFPGADWPLSVVQIDHTKLDIILVDDHYRRPIGRPWITLSFDVFSRMVTGFYISFDPPNALSTGLCLANAILPKEKLLSKFDVKNEWPVWGLPTTIHADNAKEFRGNMLQRACDEYGINLEWRPVGRPHFGAHIERSLGTFSKEIHSLPGTTFSNTKERGEYNSEKNAALTLSEFEAWFTIYIVDVYHQKIHSNLNTSPIEALKVGVFGNNSMPGVGLPARIADEERLMLDFMPYELRSVQDYGVVIDEIHYYHDVLRRWINSVDPKDSRRKRQFTFRRDPRDISQIWFYDPEIQTYYPIPYRDTSHPAISIWELREAKKIAQSDGRRHINEHNIFEAYDRMRDIEAKALERSKAARRSQQRRSYSPIPTQAHGQKAIHGSTEKSPADTHVTVIMPFDEMDDLS